MDAPPEPTALLGAGGDRPSAARLLALLLAIALPLLLYRLGAKDVWEASEGRPLQSAREMRERGDFLVQYTNGQVDLTKPPVYAWLTAAAFSITGSDTEWAGRLPSVLASLGILLLTFRLGRRIAGPRAGFLSALVLLTQWKFAWQARLAELETLLALGVLTSYSALASALDATTGPARARAFALFYLGLGFAFAVKGPIALVLVLPGSVACALAAGKGRALASAAFAFTAPIALGLGLAWYVAVVARDGRPAYETFLEYGAGKNVGHLHGPLLYLWAYPLAALPWTPLVLLGTRLPFARGVDPGLRAGTRLPFVAFATTFVALSCLHPKQTHYLIPIFPMGAILAGVWLDRFVGRGAPAARRAKLVAAAFAVVIVVFGYGLGHHVPGLDREQSSRDFMEQVGARVPPGSPIGWTIFGSHSDYLWYLPMSLVTRDGIPELVGDTEEQTLSKVTAFLRQPGTRYAIVTGAQADALQGVATALVRDDAFQKKGRRVALVANVLAGRDR